METKVTLNIDINTLNLIMGGLARLPYEQVFQTIEEIKKQVAPQIQAQQAQQPAEGSAPLAGKVIQ